MGKGLGTVMSFMLKIVVFVSLAVAFAAAHERIIFNGIVQDDSFEAHEKLNVEILETGEALQTTVGAPFSVVLPADTLWNICVTNSDTSGAEKEKCYELLYFGNDSTFSKTLGPDEVTVDEVGSGTESGINSAQAESKDPVKSWYCKNGVPWILPLRVRMTLLAFVTID